MKTVMCAVFVFSAWFVSVTALEGQNAKGTSGEEQIKALLDQARQAALKGDPSYLENNLSDDYSRVGLDGKVMNKSEVVNSMKNGETKYQSLQPSDVKVRLYGNTAIATYGTQIKGTFKGKDASGSYRVIRVFVKRAGKWQEVAFQTTRVSG